MEETIKGKYELVDVHELKYDPKNSRHHSKESIDAIKKSLQTFGQQKPIVVNSQNVVLAGNGILEAARGLLWEKIEVRRSELADLDQEAYKITDNRIAELSKWNYENLEENIDFLRSKNYEEMAVLGFTEAQDANIVNGEADEQFFKDLSKKTEGAKETLAEYVPEEREDAMVSSVLLTGPKSIIQPIVKRLAKIKKENEFELIAEAAYHALCQGGDDD